MPRGDLDGSACTLAAYEKSFNPSYLRPIRAINWAPWDARVIPAMVASATVMESRDAMQRVTITLDDGLMAALDRRMSASGHANRSETIRDLLRSGLESDGEAVSDDRRCMAALVYVYDHETRRLAERLTSEQHAHHDMSVATLHVHLDNHKCMEVAVLDGPGADVRHFADHVIAERGVQYGQLVVIPLAPTRAPTAHGHAHAPDERKSKAWKSSR